MGTRCMAAAATLMLVIALARQLPAYAGGSPVLCHGQRATIVGTALPDTLVGTPGPDVIAGLRGGDTIDGRGGNDVICGGPADDRIVGGPGDDQLFGQRGDYDDLDGGVGADRLHTGPGSLTFAFGGPGDDRIFGSSHATRAEDGEDIMVGGAGNDVLDGRAGSDELFGGPGDDVARGGAGLDRLLADPGRDLLAGGTGGDVVDFGRRWTGWESGARHQVSVHVDLAREVANAAWFGRDRLDSVEKVWTGAGDDRVIGDEAANQFLTGVGRDVVRGRGGTDTLRFTVPSRFDSGPEGALLNPSGHVEVDLAHHSFRIVHGDRTTGLSEVGGVENAVGTFHRDVLVGDARPNVLTGHYDDDVIEGRGGDDQLFGNRSDDSLDGGAGDNRINGGPGQDTCANPSGPPRATRCEIVG